MKRARIIGVAALVLVIAIAGWAATRRGRQRTPPPLPSLSMLPDFTLIDQEGRTVTRANLQGHPVVLNFIFTSCTDFCGDMTDKMAMIREALGDETSQVLSVSMSVDPERDTPALLRKFAVTHKANHPRWLFLTGSRRTVGTIMQALYLAPSGDPAQLNPTQHSSRFVLVDPTGRVRGYYQYDDEDSRIRLANDALSLVPPAAR